MWGSIGDVLSLASDVPHALGERGYAPNLEVRGNDDVFQHKLRSIEAYRSQLQIASLVDSIRQDGPYEYLRDVHFRLYSSKKYRPLFAD